jgi:hypothetical protein
MNTTTVGGQTARAHPVGQGQLGGDLQRGEDCDPGDAGHEHGHGEQTEIREVRERQRGERVQHGRAGHLDVARNLLPDARKQHGARDGTDADARQQHAVRLRAAPQLLAYHEREEGPGRAGEEEESRAADEDGLQCTRMGDEAQADADGAEETLGGQLTLARLPSPAQQESAWQRRVSETRVRSHAARGVGTETQKGSLMQALVCVQNGLW